MHSNAYISKGIQYMLKISTYLKSTLNLALDWSIFLKKFKFWLCYAFFYYSTTLLKGIWRHISVCIRRREVEQIRCKLAGFCCVYFRWIGRWIHWESVFYTWNQIILAFLHYFPVCYRVRCLIQCFDNDEFCMFSKIVTF